MVIRRCILFVVTAFVLQPALVRPDASSAATDKPASPQAAPSQVAVSGAQSALSAADLQTIQEQRATRHKKSEDLAAQLQQKLSSSLAAVTAAQQQVTQQAAQVQSSSSQQPQVQQAPQPQGQTTK